LAVSRLPVRFVGKDQAGLGDHGAGDRDPLLLAAGELLRPVAGAVGHADPLQRLGDALAPLAGGAAAIEQPDLDILGDAQVVDQVELGRRSRCGRA